MLKNLVTNSSLKAHELIANASGEDKKLNEIKVAIVGKWKGHNRGEYAITPKDMEEMVQNFKNQKLDTPCDYDHSTIYNDSAPASGWIKELYIKENELWAKVEWTPKAKEHIKAKEYRYGSPVFQFNTTDPESAENIGTTLHSFALTNNPFLEELGEIKANSKQSKEEDKKNMDKKLKEQLKKEKEKSANLQKQLDEIKKTQSEVKVNSAIERGLFAKEQKDSLLIWANSNPQAFDDFVKNAKPTIQKPQDDIFANSSKPNGKGGGDETTPINLEVM